MVATLTLGEAGISQRNSGPLAGDTPKAIAGVALGRSLTIPYQVNGPSHAIEEWPFADDRSSKRIFIGRRGDERPHRAHVLALIDGGILRGDERSHPIDSSEVTGLGPVRTRSPESAALRHSS